MLAVVGTVPDTDFPLTAGEVRLAGDKLLVKDRIVEINRGTPALLAAAWKTGEFFGGWPVFAFLVGDTGLGRGSRQLYEYLTKNLVRQSPGLITFHYLQPDVDWHNKVLFSVDEMPVRPTLIADAGFMYAAKMSGLAAHYDLFTPDIGELAFLADETAPHPFYTRGFILHEDNKTKDLIARAYANDNAAKYLLVKGQPDMIADRDKTIASIGRPIVPAMEAIGGTGDSLTGLVAALIYSGLAIEDAAALAAQANRMAGELAGLTPASQISDLIHRIPAALAELLAEERYAKK